jgi:hypothetical protein
MTAIADHSRMRTIAGLMIVEAASLAIGATLHLSGRVHGRGQPFDANHAGAAEGVLAVLLAGGAIAMLRGGPHARRTGIAVTAIAVIGFLNGLSMTARGGDLPDIAYHLVTLPLLIGGLFTLGRSG